MERRSLNYTGPHSAFVGAVTAIVPFNLLKSGIVLAHTPFHQVDGAFANMGDRKQRVDDRTDCGWEK